MSHVDVPRRPSPRAAPTLREWLREAPFSLALSSGFFGFFAHAGLVTVLEDEGLSPSRLAGSSAGALVAGLWAAGLPGAAMRDELLRLRREDFWDPRPGAGLLRGRKFRGRLDALLPVATFGECRTPLCVSVFDLLSGRTRVLRDGPLAPALQASCTVPLLFHPTWLDGRPLLDGGILDRPGLDGLPHGERVLHHHLASRSPWRRRGSPSMSVPRREGLTALVIPGLPRVGPFRLEEGARAFEVARRAAREALDRPVRDAVVEVDPRTRPLTTDGA
jgi:NTE family protein